MDQTFQPPFSDLPFSAQIRRDSRLVCVFGFFPVYCFSSFSQAPAPFLRNFKNPSPERRAQLPAPRYFCLSNPLSLPQIRNDPRFPFPFTFTRSLKTNTLFQRTLTFSGAGGWPAPFHSRGSGAVGLSPFFLVVMSLARPDGPRPFASPFRFGTPVYPSLVPCVGKCSTQFSVPPTSSRTSRRSPSLQMVPTFFYLPLDSSLPWSSFAFFC